MDTDKSLSPEQIRSFLEGSTALQVSGQSRREIYAWMKQTLLVQQYLQQRKKARGLLRAYLMKMSGLSSPQITRLILQYRITGDIVVMPSRRRCFPSRFTDADIALLVEVDNAHERLSGPATRRILQREFQTFDRKQFQRLAGISVSHLYNLRRSLVYRSRTSEFQTTHASKVSIGERRRPEPGGQAGFLRVDTVHQGDWDGAKGVYHINAVDAVTQWEVVGCAEKISESYLLPVLEAILHQFPFPVLGFHSDNGSEYVNHTVAKLLNKLLVEFTKSRACKSQDNALVEGKNASIIRKHIGYGHIPAEHADKVQRFYMAHFNPYLNFHRPCGFATVTLDARGKRKRTYKAKDYATPYEKLKSLSPNILKQGLSFEKLDAIAQANSDTECAKKMREAKRKLLRSCKIESPFPPRFDA